ncbi:hypothetical protein [Streptomyces sp. NPDC015125]|uniref:hypothetical protein n=1 Tax=Streptomyces sp. NPDC015125 TaxID=3364938 RepID=UPI0036F7A7FA
MSTTPSHNSVCAATDSEPPAARRELASRLGTASVVDGTAKASAAFESALAVASATADWIFHAVSVASVGTATSPQA